MRALILASVLLAGCQRQLMRPSSETLEQGRSNNEWQRMKECADQAEHEFLQTGFKRAGSAVGGDDLVNHYDPFRRQCFVLVSSARLMKGEGALRSTMNVTKGLYDAFDRKQYGEYGWFSDPVKKAWDNPPVQCYVLNAAGDKVSCKSEEEFAEMVRPYIEAPKPRNANPGMPAQSNPHADR